MKEITEWRKATENLTKAFCKKYFPDERYGKDTYWVGDQMGGVFFVYDFFFDVNHMIEALELKATYEQLSTYDCESLKWEMYNPGKPFHTNFKNYVKYGLIGVPKENDVDL